MKTFLAIIVLLCSCLNAYGKPMSVIIDGKQAKKIFNMLTGNQVHNEGAAGHTYRQAKNIICRYTTADMEDNHGKPVPVNAMDRYRCTININHNGIE